ncbi:ribonuclease H-like domain-containing protein [Tanacetum coccineum]
MISTIHFKIVIRVLVEQEVKRSVTSSSNSNSQNVAFVSTPSSTNDVNTSNVLVKFASSSLSIASSTDNTARLSDATIYAFLDNQPNGSQRTRKKIIINGSDTAGYDKKKVECFNCHKMGHFVRECRNLRSQENRSRNQDSSRRTMNVEESSSKAMLAIDGAGVDWSYMTEEEVPTNFALMAFSDSEVLNNKTCSKTCLKSFEDLKSQYDNLIIELNKSKSDLANYKRGLASVEEPLVFYKKNEVMFTDQIDEFKQPEFEGYGVKVKKNVSENSSNEIKKTSGALIIEDWVSDSDEDETIEKVSESANVQKPKQADQPRKVSQNPRNNNCDFHDKKMVQKPVLNNVKKGTGQREVRPVWNNAMRTNHQNFSNSRRNFAPTAVLTKSGLVPISTARQSSSRTAATVSTARPIKTAAPKPFVNVAKTRPNAFQKSHSPSRRPFYQQTALKNRNLNNKVNTVKVNSVNTAKGKRVTSAVGEQGIDAVKSKACWVWRPKLKVLDHVSKNSRSYMCKQFDYVDPTGRVKSVMAWVPKRRFNFYYGVLCRWGSTGGLFFKAILGSEEFQSDSTTFLLMSDWTATVKIVNDGEQQITVTIDGHKFAITEASVRRHLQLADVDGLSSLPNTKIFEQLSLMGSGDHLDSTRHMTQLIMCGGMIKEIFSQGEALKFCFIQGDDYISTSGEALAL